MRAELDGGGWRLPGNRTLSLEQLRTYLDQGALLIMLVHALALEEPPDDGDPLVDKADSFTGASRDGVAHGAQPCAR